MGYIYILGTILFTVLGQVVIKWRMDFYRQVPEGVIGKTIFILQLFKDPFILLGLISAFFASACWFLVLTKFSLSYAYPFIGFTYLMVLLAAVLIFKEPYNLYKFIGVFLIMVGILVSSKGGD